MMIIAGELCKLLLDINQNCNGGATAVGITNLQPMGVGLLVEDHRYK